MSTQSRVSATITGDRISITLDGRYRSFPRNSGQGKKLEEAVKRKPQDLDEIRLIADVAAYVAAQSFGRVIIDDRDRLRLDGHVVDYIAAETFKRVLAEGFDIEPLTKFIEKVHLNPDKSIAADLYAFLEKGNLPLTPDGNFHAFKRVGEDFFDLHSHTVEYKVGSTVEMDRAKCDTNRNQTCSSGLHACSFDYLRAFHGGRGKIIIVEINPQDVTAIPVDYNQAKLRCCKMFVHGVIPEADAEKFFSSAVDRRFAEQDKADTASEVQDDPEDATDATVADGVTVTATAPEAEASGAAEVNAPVDTTEAGAVTPDWKALGEAAGYKDGESDQQNGYEYDASFMMPDELNDGPDSARQAYSEGYVKGYGAGFTQSRDDAEADDEQAAGDEDDQTDASDSSQAPELDANGFPTQDKVMALHLAKTWGAEDAQAELAKIAGKPKDIIELDEYAGARRDHVSDSQIEEDLDFSEESFITAYDDAFMTEVKGQYVAAIKALGAAEGAADATNDGLFNLNVENGDSRYDIENLDIDGVKDGGVDLTEDSAIALYDQAYAAAYVATFQAKS
uniref:RIIB lysis inhibitor n=1 Tax=Caulobacter phage BL57 TaxID=3348355 RepID=A0AB74UME3_9VIRU